MGAAETYICHCDSCDYHYEFVSAEKTQRAYTYHKYRHRDHDISVRSISGSIRQSDFLHIKDQTERNDYEFEQNYRRYMSWRLSVAKLLAIVDPRRS